MPGVFDSLVSLTKAPTVEVLIERLEPGALSLVQSKAAHSIAKAVRSDGEKREEFKKAGAIEALDLLYGHEGANQTVKIAALEGLVAMQAKSSVVPLVQILQSSAGPLAAKAAQDRDMDLKVWAMDSLSWLLVVKPAYQKAAKDAGVVPAIAPLPQRDSHKVIMELLGPQDSNRLRSPSRSGGSVSSQTSNAERRLEELVEEGNDAEATSAQPPVQQANAGATQSAAAQQESVSQPQWLTREPATANPMSAVEPATEAFQKLGVSSPDRHLS